MIPELHYISRGTTAQEHLEQVQKACSSGIELVQLDLQYIALKQRETLAKEILAITTHFQTRLIIKSHYQLAIDLKTDGVYLENSDACPTMVRDALYNWQSIGATAHNLAECETVIAKDVDYIILEPYTTENKNKQNELGINGFTAILDALQTQTPVLGHGSITLEDVPRILETGIAGIAVSRAITSNFEHIKTFHKLLNASSTQEQRHSFT